MMKDNIRSCFFKNWTLHSSFYNHIFVADKSLSVVMFIKDSVDLTAYMFVNIKTVKWLLGGKEISPSPFCSISLGEKHLAQG